MNGPMIERTECFNRDAIEFRLTIPGWWLVTTRFPRLHLAWWLVKLAFSENRKKDGNVV